MLKKISGLIAAGTVCFLLNIGYALAASGCTLNGEEIPCDELFDQFGGLFAGLGVLMIILPIIALFGFVFWLMMIIHAASNPIENKPLWIVVLVFTGFVGAIVYYFVIKRPYSQANRPFMPSQSYQPGGPVPPRPPSGPPVLK